MYPSRLHGTVSFLVTYQEAWWGGGWGGGEPELTPVSLIPHTATRSASVALEGAIINLGIEKKAQGDRMDFLQNC